MTAVPDLAPIAPDEHPIWIAHPSATPQHALFDALLWRGVVFGTVEAFSDLGPFYAWIGSFPSCGAGSTRLGGFSTLQAARRAVRDGAAAQIRLALDHQVLQRMEVA